MSRFTVRKPTVEVVSDVPQGHHTHVQVTSEAPWDPKSSECAREEAAVWQQLTTDFDFRERGTREVYACHARGQDSGDSTDLSKEMQPHETEQLALDVEQLNLKSSASDVVSEHNKKRKADEHMEAQPSKKRLTRKTTTPSGGTLLRRK